MTSLSGKKILLLGVIVVLLIGIPLTIYLLQHQQELRSRAQKSTTVSFAPTSSQLSPIQKSIGDSVPLDITVDPGQNLVSFVKIIVQYDSTKLATDSAAFTPNTTAFPTILEGPVYSDGKIAVTLSIGADPTKAIQQPTKAATVTFKAIGATKGTPTQITYTTDTQVLSIGSSDQASEDVLSAANPAFVNIADAAGSPTPSAGPTSTPVPNATATPIATPTPQATATPIPQATATPGPTGAASQGPTCSNLAVSPSTTGIAPFAATLTATGTSSNSTISQITFNFGDGGVQQATDSATGIGTNSVNTPIAHTYNNPGTYQVSAILTDALGVTSSASSCKNTITVTAANNGTNPTATPALSPTLAGPTPTLAPTGPGNTVISVGIFVTILTVAGAILFFAL